MAFVLFDSARIFPQNDLLVLLSGEQRELPELQVLLGNQLQHSCKYVTSTLPEACCKYLS